MLALGDGWHLAKVQVGTATLLWLGWCDRGPGGTLVGSGVAGAYQYQSV